MRSAAVWRGVLLALLAVASVAALYVAFVQARADMATLRARANLADWQTRLPKTLPLAELGRAERDLRAGLALVPDDPNLHEGLAFISGWRASYASAVPELRDALLEAMVTHYRAALQSRPMAPYAWAGVERGLHLLVREPAAMWLAFDRALAYGSREGGVQTQLAMIALARWASLDEARRQAVLTMVAGATGKSLGVLQQQFAAAGIALPEASGAAD